MEVVKIYLSIGFILAGLLVGIIAARNDEPDLLKVAAFVVFWPFLLVAFAIGTAMDIMRRRV